MKRSVFSLLALLLPYMAFAHDFIVDGICYNVVSEEDKCCEVTFKADEPRPDGVYYKFYKDVVFVPEKVNYGGKEYSVTAIGEKAFELNDELLSVVMPKTIVSIGHDAFANCPKLKSLTIPESVRDFQNFSFRGLPSLESLVVDEKNEFFDSREGCNAIIKTHSNALYVGCKNTVIPDGVKAIANGAFMTCFGGRDIEPFEITVPKSVEVIDHQAFAGCLPLKAVNFSEGLKKIGGNAFIGTPIKRVVIPASVTEIDPEAFAACDSLKVIKVKRGNKVYDSRKGCNAIIESETGRLIVSCTATEIPEGVKIIATNAFAKSAIKEVQFPSSLELIEYSAFWGCRELKKVVIPGNVKVIESSAFSASSIEEVIVEDGVEEIGVEVFAGCRKLKSVTLPVSFERKKDYRFSSLFRGCRELERVRLGNDNETYYCNGSVLLEKETRTVIDGWGIDQCYVGNGFVRLKAKKIGRRAFEGHELLAKVTLPETLEEIETRAFYDCNSLRLIECKAQVPPVLADDAFATSKRMHDHTLPLQERAVVVVPKGTLDAYRNAPGWKEFKHITEKDFSF